MYDTSQFLSQPREHFTPTWLRKESWPQPHGCLRRMWRIVSVMKSAPSQHTCVSSEWWPAASRSVQRNKAAGWRQFLLLKQLLTVIRMDSSGCRNVVKCSLYLDDLSSPPNGSFLSPRWVGLMTFTWCLPLLFTRVFTRVQVHLLQVKVERLPFTFCSSESSEVHKMVYTFISKVQSIFSPFFGRVKCTWVKSIK